MTKKNYMFYRISYSKSRDAFSTWVYVGEKKFPEWNDFGLELECRCVRAFIEETGMPTDEPNYLNYQVVTHIRQALQLGYTIQFCDRPEGE